MGIGATLTVFFAGGVARFFIPTMLTFVHYVNLLKRTQGLLDHITSCFAPCKGWMSNITSCFAPCKEWMSSITSCFAPCKEYMSIITSCFASFRSSHPTTIFCAFVAFSSASGLLVVLGYGMGRGIGLLPTLRMPRDNTETDALKSLEHEFGPGPVACCLL